MLKMTATSQVKNDLERLRGKHWNMNLFREAVRAIARSDEQPIPARFEDHAMDGMRQGYRMMKLGGRSNWVLLYVIDDTKAVIVRTGPNDGKLA